MFRKKSKSVAPVLGWLQEEVVTEMGVGHPYRQPQSGGTPAVGTPHKALATLKTGLFPVASFMSPSPN